jgi:predicted nucleic acid-binding protein
VKYLLDTCVISEVIKPAPDPMVLGWLDGRDETALFLSVLTLGELQKGICKLQDTRKRRRLQAWVETELATRFQGRILSIDADVAITWGVIQGTAEKLGERLPVTDSLIAATALAHNLTVVTRNVQDFARCQVQLFNPWTD